MIKNLIKLYIKIKMRNYNNINKIITKKYNRNYDIYLSYQIIILQVKIFKPPINNIYNKKSEKLLIKQTKRIFYLKYLKIFKLIKLARIIIKMIV